MAVYFLCDVTPNLSDVHRGAFDGSSESEHGGNLSFDALAHNQSSHITSGDSNFVSSG